VNDYSYLRGLISQGEHVQQDFKYRVQDAVKLARSVSAFANTEGGRLLIGVRDDGHISGVRDDEEIFMMHQAAWKYCQPAASIKFDTYHVEGRTVVVATVPESKKKPVYALEQEASYGRTATDEKGMMKRAYIRIADENIVASPVHLAIWREEQAARGSILTYGEAEQQLLAALQTETLQRLNNIVKRARLPRYKVIALLARLIRYGVATCQYDGKEFLFAMK